MQFSDNKSGLRLLFSGLLPLFVLAHFGHHLLTALPIPLLPMIRSDFALDYTQAGWVVSAFNLAYGIGQLPGGWLTDRIGPRLMITIGICGVSLAGFLVGLSHIFMLMIFFLALMGLLGGGYHPAAPPMIFALVPPQVQGRALGLHMVGGGASFFLAPIIAMAIAASWGWRGSFIGLAVPTLIFGILFYVILGKPKAAKQNDQGPAQAKEEEGFSSPGRVRGLIPFFVLSTFTGAMVFTATSFVPLFLVDHFGFPKETAGIFYALIYSAGLWASPLGGYLSDRWGRVPVILTVCFLSGPLIYLLNYAPSRWSIVLLLLAIGMIIYVRMPVSEAYIIRQTPVRNRSAVLGLYFFASMEGGGLLAPGMGYLIDHLGFYYSFTIAGASLLLATLLSSIWLWGSRD